MLTTLFIIMAYVIDYTLIALIVMIFVRWILSAFHLSDSNPIMLFLTRCTEPIVLPFRRRVPPVSILDMSLIFASVSLWIVRMLLLQAIPIVLR